MLPINLEDFLKKTLDFHGHICAGQPLGYRMAMAGLREIGVPNGEEDNVLAFVEFGGCIADAIQLATGITLGHGSLKFYDYGKFAATFLNTETGNAVRVSQRKEAKDEALAYAKGRGWSSGREGDMSSEDEETELLLKAYSAMPEDQLFTVKKVKVDLPPEDTPGKPMHIVTCNGCGELVFRNREIMRDGKPYCKSCVQGAYYSTL
jgi:formylmethanofuran dehydrogenase subunit E